MLNVLLAFYLLIAAPTMQMWRSLRSHGDKPPTPLRSRYWSMTWKVLTLLTLLWLGAREAGYTASQLGFDTPVSRAGLWGLAFAVLLLDAIALAGSLSGRSHTPERRAEEERKMLASSFPWPRTRTDLLGFVVSMSLVTAAWEVLYRGFLLLLLTPYTGLPVAIIASALAYGLAHGYESPKQLIGSIVSAFIFTIAYALTHSLWWLIVIHAGLPLSALPAVYRIRRRRETQPPDTMPKQV